MSKKQQIKNFRNILFNLHYNRLYSYALKRYTKESDSGAWRTVSAEPLSEMCAILTPTDHINIRIKVSYVSFETKLTLLFSQTKRCSIFSRHDTYKRRILKVWVTFEVHARADSRQDVAWTDHTKILALWITIFLILHT